MSSTVAFRSDYDVVWDLIPIDLWLPSRIRSLQSGDHVMHTFLIHVCQQQYLQTAVTLANCFKIAYMADSTGPHLMLA